MCLTLDLGKTVAIKIQNLKEISTIEKDINEEYRILRDLSSHSNLPDFYGAFTNKNGIELWFVMEVYRIYVFMFLCLYVFFLLTKNIFNSMFLFKYINYEL